jgi:hypothetical protein
MTLLGRQAIHWDGCFTGRGEQELSVTLVNALSYGKLWLPPDSLTRGSLSARATHWKGRGGGGGS